MAPLKIAIVGVGKIARDQHLPVIEDSEDFTLIAVTSRQTSVAGVHNFTRIEDMLAALPELDAVALCTPPQGRHKLARQALAQGKHVFLEKPPGASLGEVDDLVRLADAQTRTLFASWHSRFAPAVEMARDWLRDRRILSVKVAWKEDVRHWHPGQDWIWQPGGLGVFDPGINGVSILTRILPEAIFLDHGELFFPANRAAPIAADLHFSDAAGLRINMTLDWRQTGPQSWDIEILTEGGALLMTHGGARLLIDGVEQTLPAEAEYGGLYRHFAALIRAGRSEVDVTPLRLVADAFLLCRHSRVEDFID
jgi:D-galactose 1-dehydrogenase